MIFLSTSVCVAINVYNTHTSIYFLFDELLYMGNICYQRIIGYVLHIYVLSHVVVDEKRLKC